MLVIKNTPTADALRASQSMAQSLNNLTSFMHRRGTYGGNVSNVLYDEEKAKKLEEIRQEQEKANAQLEEAGPMSRAVAAAMNEMEKSQGGFGLQGESNTLSSELETGYGPNARRMMGKLNDMTTPIKDEKQAAYDSAHKRMGEKDIGGYGVGLNKESRTGYGPKAESKRTELEDKYKAQKTEEVKKLQEEDPVFAKQYEQLQKHYQKIRETGELEEKSKKFSEKAKKLQKLVDMNPEIIPGSTREEQYSYVYNQFNKAMKEAGSRTEVLDAWNNGQANMRNLDRYWEKNDANNFFRPSTLKAYLGRFNKKESGGRRKNVEVFSVKGTKGGEFANITFTLDEDFDGARYVDRVKKKLSDDDLKDPEKVANALEKMGEDGATLASHVRQNRITLDKINDISRHNPGEGEAHVLKENKELREELRQYQGDPEGTADVLKRYGIPYVSYLKANPEMIERFHDQGKIEWQTKLALQLKYGDKEMREEARAEIERAKESKTAFREQRFGPYR